MTNVIPQVYNVSTQMIVYIFKPCKWQLSYNVSS